MTKQEPKKMEIEIRGGDKDERETDVEPAGDFGRLTAKQIRRVDDLSRRINLRQKRLVRTGTEEKVHLPIVYPPLIGRTRPAPKRPRLLELEEPEIETDGDRLRAARRRLAKLSKAEQRYRRLRTKLQKSFVYQLLTSQADRDGTYQIKEIASQMGNPSGTTNQEEWKISGSLTV